jgi:EAL domain-containing protein (putative c-di-GMP-specific phosphodiesterase class I)
MSIRDNIENFIIGDNIFLKDEESLKYRFILMRSMLIVTTVVVATMAIIRFITGYYLLTSIELLVVSILLGFYYTLEKRRDKFELIATISLGMIYMLFSAAVVLLKDEPLKLIWYALFIVASFMLKGYKFGIKIYLLCVVTLLTLYLLVPIELYLDNRDIAMALIAYTSFALFMTFSEIQHKKNLTSIKRRNKEIEETQQLLYKQARVDPITLLPNKVVLREDIENSTENISLMVLDIDQYEVLTNEFGESFMESIHKRVAKIFKALAIDNITAYHIFGSRFAFLIKDPTLNQELILSDKINSIFNRLKLECEQMQISINFLIAIVQEKENALSNANLTLRQIKQGDIKQKVAIYKKDLKKEEQQKQNLYWAKRLIELINDDKIVVYYQPIVDNISKEVVKYECLVRAIDNDKVISPYFFISVAKSKGTLTTITKIVIDKSFKEFSNSDYDFSINITDQDLRENYLASYLKEKADEYDIDPKRVFLEVLENINSEDSNYAYKQFQELRDLGFGIAIDDFGAEASNLSRLLTLRADIIKIDGQFIKNIDKDIDSVMIVETVVSLAKKMRAKTVAEFVHNEDIYHIVKNLGVDYSQGYYFSQPLPKIEKESEIAEAL